MLDSKAEDDDDEGFGEFTFAASSSSSSDQINGPKNATTTHSSSSSSFDNDWGDFVESTGVSNAQPSKPLNPSGFPSDQSKLTTSESDSRWVKPRGALPLSMFGEVEQDGEEELSTVGSSLGDGKDSALVIIKSGTTVSDMYSKNGCNSDPNVIGKSQVLSGLDFAHAQAGSVSGVRYLFSGDNDLLSQRIKAENGFNWDLNGVDPSRIEKSLILNGMDFAQSQISSVSGARDLFSGGDNNLLGQQIKAVSGLGADSKGSDQIALVKDPILNGASSGGMGSILDLFGGSNGIQSPQVSSLTGVSLDTSLFSGGNNNFVSQQIKAVSGFNSDSNRSDPNAVEKKPILNGASSLGMDSILNLFAGNNEFQSPRIDAVNGVGQNADLFSGGNNIQGEQIKAVDGLNTNLDLFGGPQIREVCGFNSYSSGMNLNADSFSGSTGVDKVSNGYGQDQLNNFETSNGLSSNLSTSSPITMVNGEEFYEDYDGWEFKDAYSELKDGNGSNKVGGKNEGNFGVTGLSFEFGNGLHGSDLFSSSNGFSGQPAKMDVSFDFKPLTVAQSGFNSNSLSRSEQNVTENGLNSDHAVGFVEDDESFGEFEGAFTETGLNQEVGRKDEGNFGETGLSFEFGNGSNGSDLFSSSNGFPVQPTEVDISSNFQQLTVSQNGISSHSLLRSEKNDAENGLTSDCIVGIVGSDESFGDFEGAVTRTGLSQEENHTVTSNHKGALPLSIFGDEEPETDDSPKVQDAFTFKPSYSSNGIDSQGSNICINDLISNLYSQSQQTPPVDNTSKHTGNGLDLDEVLDLSLVNGDDDFEDASWEFKDASFQTSTLDQTYSQTQGKNCDDFGTNLKMVTHVDFYCKLKEELSIACRGHLDNLMRAKHAAALSGEDAKVAAIDKEIKEACKELHEENIYSKEWSEDGLQRDVCLKEFIEISKLQFQVLELEYGLPERLHLAEQDLGSAVELMKHATSMLDVLTVGSTEDQGIYVSTWSMLISVCAQELKHGAWIWKQFVEKNIQSEILSKSRGKEFILALGEIYRVVAVLAASTKFYKPWILSSSIDFTSIYAVLEECDTLWSTSGIEEALHNISDPIDFEYHSTVKALRESIRFIRDNELTDGNCTLNQQISICQLSLLTSEAVPDIKMVLWDGKYYFLPLANLWANLIACDPPELPYLDVGS